MSPKLNNAFAALLIAGIVAMMAGFVSSIVFHSEPLEQEAYPIAAAEGGAGAEVAGAAPAEAEPIGDLMAAADVTQGEKLSKMCAACHTFDKGGANRVGPNLAGIVGAKHAHMPDFAYSDAMKASGGNWSVEELNKFLWNPKKTIPGTKMAFAGLKKPEDRAAVIKFLQTK